MSRGWLLHAAVLGLVLLILAPFLWLLQMSLKTQADIFAFPPRLAFVPTLEHYRTIWDTAFRRSFANSAIVAVLSTALAMVLGVPGAYALSRARFGAAGTLGGLGHAKLTFPGCSFVLEPRSIVVCSHELLMRRRRLLESTAGLIHALPGSAEQTDLQSCRVGVRKPRHRAYGSGPPTGCSCRRCSAPGRQSCP